MSAPFIFVIFGFFCKSFIFINEMSSNLVFLASRSARGSRVAQSALFFKDYKSAMMWRLLRKL